VEPPANKVPADIFTTALFGPKPFLFFERATTDTDLPFLIPLIVQVVFSFFIVHDLPPAVTLLPVIFDSPFVVGKEIVTFRLTFPFFGVEEATETTVGADGFATLTLVERA
jgi:hypothetical protein